MLRLLLIVVLASLNLRDTWMFLHDTGDLAGICVNFGMLRVEGSFCEFAEINVALIEVVVLHEVLFMLLYTETDIK